MKTCSYKHIVEQAPGACSMLHLFGPLMYVYWAVRMYVLFPFVLLPVPHCDDIVLQAILTISAVKSESSPELELVRVTVLAGVGVRAGVSKAWPTLTPAQSHRLTPGSGRWLWMNSYASSQKH